MHMPYRHCNLFENTKQVSVHWSILGYFGFKKPALIWSWQLNDVFQSSLGYAFLTGNPVFRLGQLLRSFNDVDVHGCFVHPLKCTHHHKTRPKVWNVLGVSYRISIGSGLREKSGGTSFLWWVTMVFYSPFIFSIPWTMASPCSCCTCWMRKNADSCRWQTIRATWRGNGRWSQLGSNGIPNEFREPNGSMEVGLDLQNKRTALHWMGE